MTAAAHRLGRPYAAFTVMETLLGEFDETAITVPRERRKRMAEMTRIS